jgi:hypothetical protein
MTDLTDLTRFTEGSIAGRAERLPGPLRELHRAVLRRFMETGAPPTARWLRQAAAESARAYLTSRGGLDAQILDQDTAIECGRLNFGALLTDAA